MESNGLVVLTDKTVFLPQKVLDDNPTTISVAYPGDIIIAKGGNTLAKVGLVTDEYPIGKTGYTDFTGKRARQVTKEDYGYYDYLLCADGNNIRNTIRITGPDKDNKIRLLMDFAGKPGRSIADPWYTGRFDETYKDVVEGCEGLLDFLGLK